MQCIKQYFSTISRIGDYYSYSNVDYNKSFINCFIRFNYSKGNNSFIPLYCYTNSTRKALTKYVDNQEDIINTEFYFPIINQDKQRVGSTKDLFRYYGYSGANIIFENNEYYFGRGILLDSDFNVLFILFFNPNTNESEYRLSYKLCTSSVRIEKLIYKHILEICSEKNKLFNSKDKNKIIIEDTDKYILKVNKPCLSTFTTDDIKNTLLNFNNEDCIFEE